jgi:hypothetical protein
MLKIYCDKGFKHNPPINVDYTKDATTTQTDRPRLDQEI